MAGQLLFGRDESMPSAATLLAVGVVSLALVIASVWMAQALRLAACPLCIFQRLLYLLVAALAVIGALRAVPGWRRLFGGAAALAALGGMATAAYQGWLQWAQLASLECSYTDPNLIERLVDWLGMQWPLLFRASGLCSSKEWSWLGLSLANWSFLAFGALAVGLVLALRAKKRTALS